MDFQFAALGISESPGMPVGRIGRLAVRALFLIAGVLIFASAQAQVFTKVTTGPVVSDGKGGRSVNFVDVNNDGFLDIFVTNGKVGGQNNLLYLNNTDATFTEASGLSLVTDGGSSDGASFVDVDNDGDVDVAIANWYNQNNFLHLNNGDGTFTKVTSGAVVADNGFSEACSWADFDSDGDLDLFVANSEGNKKDFLYYNNGQAGFTRIDTGVVASDVSFTRLGSWADYDNDGDIDLYVVTEGVETNEMYSNDGGAFSKVTISGVTTDMTVAMGSSWGDYDNDGDLDLFVATNFNRVNQLFTNNGDGTFTAVTVGPVVNDLSWSFGSSWIDYDNDGDLDLFVTNGFSTIGAVHKNFLYTNNGDGSFTKVTTGPISTDEGWSYGHAWGDYDHDGDLDVVIARWLNETENNLFYTNESAGSNHWLSVSPRGVESNVSAIGARIRIKATIGGSPVWQMREISSQDGYCCQNGLLAHFGLGDATTIDSLEVRWPNGTITSQESVPADQFLVVSECDNVDGDRLCDSNDSCPLDQFNDADADGLCADVDNCPNDFNPDQTDTDLDGIGDVCDVCCNIAGDANGDTQVNVIDVTFLIARIFAAGTAPSCNDAADANADNNVNIQDITYLIARIFAGGSAPICGTSGT